MKVVVAISTGGVDRFEMALLMAPSTRDDLVMSFETKLSNRVIKEWDLPPLEAMVTLVTFVLLELTPMHIGVTERTLLLGVILCLGACWMTSVARLLHMPAFQRKPCNTVIKTSLFPVNR